MTRKVSWAIRQIQKDGWYLKAHKGSHRQYCHETKKGKVTIAGKQSDDLPEKTLKSIAKQAGIDF